MDVAAGDSRRAGRPSGPWPWCCSRASDRPSRRPAPARLAVSASRTAPEAWRVASLGVGLRGNRRRASRSRRRSRRQFAALAAQEFGTAVRRQRLQARFPGAANGLAAFARRAPVGANVLGDRQRAGSSSRAARAHRRSRPQPSGEPCAAAVPALVGAPKAIDRAAGDQARPVALLRAPDGGGDRVGVVAVDALGGPAMRAKARRSGRRRRRAAVGPSIEIELSS